MKITLDRLIQGKFHTCGFLKLNNKPECFTLEDIHRDIKIDGSTRVPAGIYEVKLRTEGGLTKKYSEKFGDFHKGMLWLQDVPNFEWIYIHYGNYSRHTEGCILVGESGSIVEDFTGNSVKTYKKLYSKIIEAMKTEKIFIEIIDYNV